MKKKSIFRMEKEVNVLLKNELIVEKYYSLVLFIPSPTITI